MPQPSNVRSDIYKNYIDEYQHRESRERKGIAGFINRITGGIPKDGDGGATVILGAVAGVLSAAVVVTVGKWIPSLAEHVRRSRDTIMMAGMLSSAFAATVSRVIVTSAGAEKLKKDIDAGALNRRYADEVLKPALARESVQSRERIAEFSSALDAVERGDLSVAFTARPEAAYSGPFDLREKAVKAPKISKG